MMEIKAGKLYDIGRVSPVLRLWKNVGCMLYGSFIIV
jgi:hypothetical protein